MSDKTRSGIGNGAVSRRIFLTTGVAGVAAVTAGCVLGTRSPAPPSGAGATSRKPTLSAPFGKSGDTILVFLYYSQLKSENQYGVPGFNGFKFDS
jgi:hypothetical protein